MRPRIELRTLTRADYPTIARWRRDRAWRTWWGPARTEDELEEDYGPTIDGQEPTVMAIAVLLEPGRAPRDIGLVEHYRIADHPEWDAQIDIPGAAGVDYGIGDPADRGRGLGTELLVTLVDEAFDAYPDCTCVVAAPKSANRASCGVLEAIGMSLVRTTHLTGEWPEEGDSSIYRVTRTAWDERGRG